MPDQTSRRRFFKRAALATGVGALLAAAFGLMRRRSSAPTSDDDAFAWLEQIDGPRARAWVASENRRTGEAFAAGGDFARMRDGILAVQDRPDRIAWFSRYGEHFYNLWRDDDHALGLWRRTTPTQYRLPQPQWETVLDLDALSRKEGVQWLLTGVAVLEPQARHCLLSLSAGGGDAAEVREFDLVEKCFVEDGFRLPQAKSVVSWINRDEIFVATDTGPGSLTQAGYPRVARRWRRGTPLSQAPVVFEAQPHDVDVQAFHDAEPGFARDLVVRTIDSRHSETRLLSASGQLLRIDVPTDAHIRMHRQYLLITLASSWEVAGQKYATGSLLAIGLDAFLAGAREFKVLFRPDGRQVLGALEFTRDHLIISVMEDLTARLLVLTERDGKWHQQALPAPAGLLSLSVGALSRYSNAYCLVVAGFTRPPALYFGNLDSPAGPELVRQEADHFDAGNYAVSQHFATSADGTRVPYFQIARRGLVARGDHPTLLYGYGGFEVSLLPEYLDAGSAAWLARGGVYVVANIRGGGEYGPQWHQAALRQYRHRAYEDFAAVAKDLVARGITSPDRLGARGSSNGGLLVGNMLVHYPQLFGCLVCEAPLLDMRRYTALSAGASWIAEYGDPEQPGDWDFLRTFSPFHNVRRDGSYPPVLFVTATNDDRTHPAHARKMAARMRGMGFDQVYFHESRAGGHGGALDNEQYAFDEALVQEFLWRSLAAPRQA